VRGVWKIILRTFRRILKTDGGPNYSGTTLAMQWFVRNTLYMKFILEVGEAEKHKVEFNFNQLLGSLLIAVDSKPIYKSQRMFNEPVREVFNFQVGDYEQVLVRIEKTRRQLFGHRNCVYLDNRLAHVKSGY
jgi:hypothetical protein